MSQWIELPGSPAYVKGPGAARLRTRIFHADKGAGLSSATAAGLVKGARAQHDDTTLYIDSINVRTEEGRDIVEIIEKNISEDQSHADNGYYNDGVQRYHDEEEWTWEMSCDTEVVTVRTMNYKSPPTSFSSWGTDSGIIEGDSVLCPGIMLVWRKWMRKSVAVDPTGNHYPRTLPKTKADLLAAIRTYLPSDTGGYETDPPKFGKRLGGSGIEAQFLCVDVNLEPDGDLVCRTARFKYTRDSNGWPSAFYQ